MNRSIEPCMCGDTDCPTCGTLQGTRIDPSVNRARETWAALPIMIQDTEPGRCALGCPYLFSVPSGRRYACTIRIGSGMVADKLIHLHDYPERSKFCMRAERMWTRLTKVR